MARSRPFRLPVLVGGAASAALIANEVWTIANPVESSLPLPLSSIPPIYTVPPLVEVGVLTAAVAWSWVVLLRRWLARDIERLPPTTASAPAGR